jgi:hypothetical protein
MGEYIPLFWMTLLKSCAHCEGKRQRENISAPSVNEENISVIHEPRILE